MINLKVYVFLAAGLFMLACSSLSFEADKPISVTATSTKKPIPAATLFPVPTTAGFLKSGTIVEIPSTPEVPPGDIIQQIELVGRGGPGDPTPTPFVCEWYCVEAQADKVVLYGFEPDQIVRVEIYTTESAIHKIFLKEVVIQTDQDGFFEFNVNDPDGAVYLEFDVYDETGSSLPIECTSEEMSKFSIGMNAVTAGERIWYFEIPGDSMSLLDYLDNGLKVAVAAGPVCRNGYAHWYISVGEHDAGWVLGQNMEPIE